MAIFGINSIGGSSSVLAANAKQAEQFFMPENGTITSIAFYLDNPNGSSQVARYAIFSDNGNLPGSLLSVTSDTTLTPGQSAGWVSLNLLTPIVVNSGNYWIVIHAGN